MAKKKAASKKATVKRTVSPRRNRSDNAVAQGRTVFHLSEEGLDAGLSGEDAEAEAILRSQLGEAEYAELRALADRAAQAKRGPAKERVVILPGIMGSELGKDRKILKFLTDLIWLDPLSAMIGKIESLKFVPKTLKASDPAIRALGPFPIVYWKLRLALQAAGYDAMTLGYDWRERLDVLGKFLADELNKDKSKQDIHIVGHSMGGLVTRAMLKHLKDSGDKALRSRIKRIVTLGTPHGGSFQAIKALRGTHDMANLVSDIDFSNSRFELTEKTFSTLPGLYHLLPREIDGFEVFNPKAWPSGSGLKPRGELLDFARDTAGLMAPPDGFFTIIGIDKQTTIGARVKGDKFEYVDSMNGDGTVPREFAETDTDKNLRWYCEGSHMSLPMQKNVQQGVIELLQGAAPSQLAREHTDKPGTTTFEEAPATRGLKSRGTTRKAPNDADIRDMLAPLLAKDSTTVTAVPVPAAKQTPLIVPPGFTHKLPDVVIGRRKQRQIDLELYPGDLTDCFARAYAIGTWAGVEPGGAAASVDQLMDGAIEDMFKRRFFGGQVGEIFTLPTGRWPVRCDLLVFAGMGAFDRFEKETLALVAENVVRTLVRCNVEEFAAVPFSGSTLDGEAVGTSIECLLRGFIRGVVDADRSRHFRRIILCERNPERFAAMKEELVRLATSELCDDIEICLRDLPAQPKPVVAQTRQATDTVPSLETYYLIARQQQSVVEKTDAAAGKTAVVQTTSFETSLLRPAGKGAVLTGKVLRSPNDLDNLLAATESSAFDQSALKNLGTEILNKMVAPGIADALKAISKGRGETAPQLVVLHDAAASKLPWESLVAGNWEPALEGGLIRRFLAENMSVAKWLEERARSRELNVLLVVDPTGDLPGARAEGAFLRDFFKSQSGIRVTERFQAVATRDQLLKDFKSGEYDVVHYAGHGGFQPNLPARSGLLCAGREMLTGADLSVLGQLPMLVFFNACQVGRIRNASNEDRPEREMNTGVAEALLRGGVANFLGTYWSVGDSAAKAFAETFYPAVLKGASLGDAVLAARQAVHKIKSVDWADYMFYGDPTFKLTP